MNRPVRTISLWQPWATLIALGHKRYETRSWGTAHRGLVAIHAAKRPLGADERHLLRELREEHGIHLRPRELPFGAVVAVGQLATCRQMTPELCAEIFAADGPEFDVGGWEPGRWAWEIDQVQVLEVPVLLRGQKALFPWWPPKGLGIGGGP